MNIYPVDSPPELKHQDGFGNVSACDWYTEWPHFIVTFYENSPTTITAFVNMSFNPTSADVQTAIERALIAMKFSRRVVNLRLNNWSGNTNAFWYADLEEPS